MGLGGWSKGKYFSVPGVVVGIIHQSNGQTVPYSRSWNRIYGRVIFEKDDFYVSGRLWYRIPEPKKSSPDDTNGDDNPNIYKYMGYGDVQMLYKYKKYKFALHLRNNGSFKKNRGSYQADISFLIKRRLFWYLQYFNGFGESLIDYDQRINRFGIGIKLTDWL